MLIEKRNFIGGCNSDVNPRMLQDSEMLNCMNARMAVSELGRTLRLENLLGTELKTQSVFPPYGTNQCLGSGVDEARRRILFLQYNSFGYHGIYCFDVDTATMYAVLYDSQTTDGLGFSKSYRVDRNVRIVGDLMYWTDDNNQPRRINYIAGIKANHPSFTTDVAPYSFPLDENIITIIRKPPNYSLTPTKVIDGTVSNNFLKDFAGKFASFYYFRDNEQSVLSTYSLLINYNTNAENTSGYNAIDVVYSFAEQIPQDVQKIELSVQFGIDPSFFVIKIWDKSNATDLAEINAHNAGTSALTYRFYNDQTGLALSDAFSVKPFDSIPLKSKTLETALSRLFLGNNLEGYNTPLTTSLSATLNNQSQGSSISATVFYLHWNGNPGTTKYIIYLPSSTDAGYYRVTASDSVPPSSPTAFASLTYISDNLTDVFKYYIPAYPSIPVESFYQYSFISVTGTSDPLAYATVFKSNSPYRLCVNFYDRWGRKCGIVTNNTVYQTVERGYNDSTFTVGINWSLSSSIGLTTEIPDWAEFYSIGRTRCLRTTFFLQARAKNVTYATKDADGVWQFNTKTYASSLNGVGVDIQLLNSYGMGYTFSQGDFIKIYKGSSVYMLPIIGQDGNYVICQLEDIGGLGDQSTPLTPMPLFEIYTPYKESLNEPYFEVGNMYAINDAGTSNRAYSVTSGTLRGDVTVITRTISPETYLTENMSPQDRFYTQWLTDAGRPNQIDTIGQKDKINSISWSNTFIQGTKVNGLSSFDALDEKQTPQECGELQKLQVASKVTEQGNIMLSVCNNQTISMYLGETQLVGASANAFIAQSTGVIGTMNVLKGNLGTQHPSTVFEYLGLVFGLDVNNGVFWQYSSAGLEPVSRYKMSRFFKNYCKAYSEASTGNLDNINGFHHIPTCIDPFHKEVLVTLPALIYPNYANTLPSYSSVPSYATSIIDRFDIFDQLGKTMAFQFEENKWGNNYEFMPEHYEYINNTLYAWKNGALYEHNADNVNWNNFYGTQYPVRICFTGNLNPSMLKDLCNIAVESNAIPNYTVALTNYPNTQITDLASTDDQWVNQQGIFYADFLADRLSPNTSGTADQKLFTGDPLTDFSIFVMGEWQAYSSLFYCNFINIGYNISRGNKQILNPINQ